ncbi:MAG TPA: tetratricopeptide repeat protein [Fimbriimonadaceae bacterium]|nr:tetratricopeptide repeat protein [Fimbriimonadaceae bacterium]HRJ95542.1 tetratricopeptide repeat protein [Fimbriimonadaceae bacterium]
MKWLGPGLRVLGWAGLAALGVTGVAQVGAAGLMMQLGHLPMEVLKDFLAGVLHHSMGSGHKEEGRIAARAFHLCVLHSVERQTAEGLIDGREDFVRYVKRQAKAVERDWDQLAEREVSKEECKRLLDARLEPSDADIAELLRELYPALDQEVVSRVAVDVLGCFEPTFIDLLSRDDAQHAYRKRLLTAVLGQHREIMAKLEAIHTEVVEGRTEVREIRELIVAQVSINPNDPENRQQAVELYNQSVALAKEGREVDSVELLNEALRLDPTFFEAWVARAVAHAKREDHVLALGDADRALTIRPGDAHGHWVRSHIREWVQDTNGALDDAKSAADKVPSVDHLVRYGTVLSQIDRDDEAIAIFDRALSLDARSAEALYGKAISLQALGKTTEALATIDESIAIRPDWGRSRLGRGLLLKKLGRNDEAPAEFEKAMEFDPRQGQVWAQYGLMAEARGDVPEAARCYLKGIEVEPAFMANYANLGILHLDLGQYEEAVTALSVVVEGQRTGGILWARGLCYQKLGRSSEAIADFSTSLALDPTSAVTYSSRGQEYLTLGQVDEALVDLYRALELSPEDTDTRARLAQALIAAGRLEEAVAQTSQVLAVTEHPEARFRRAIAYEGLGDYAKSELDYRRLLELVDDAGVWNNLGTVIASQARWADAIAAYDRSYSMDGNPRSQVNKAVALVQAGDSNAAATLVGMVIAQHPEWREGILGNSQFSALANSPQVAAVLRS